MKALRVALIHDWLTGMRGGEYVLEAIAALFRAPEIFTLIDLPGKVSPALAAYPRHTSFLQLVPGVGDRYRFLLPLMPAAIERFDLSGFDLIVSSSHCVAKGVRKPPGAVHVSYIHAPMRYVWDRYEDYFGPGQARPHVRLAARVARPWLQRWDRRVSQADRVDALIANSAYIAEQVRRAYGREAQVIHPFADLSRFSRPRRPEAHYLMVGAFAPYKRLDLAIEAFNRLRLPLRIIGGGQDETRLRALAGPTVEFLGPRSNEEISEAYSRCRAFVFPGLEDFGITPLEAMAAGAPVIAYGEGGATETVGPRSGAFFRPQTVEALMEAVRSIESGSLVFSEADCRARVTDFSRERFQRQIAAAISEAWSRAGHEPTRLGTALCPR